MCPLSGESVIAKAKEGLEGSFDMDLKEVLKWEAFHHAIMLQSGDLKEEGSALLRSTVHRLLNQRVKRI